MGIERFGNRAYAGGEVIHTPFVRAGRWVFGTGLRATGPDGRMSPAIVDPRQPLFAAPRAQREAEAIFSEIGRALADAGSTLDGIVRLDQYYPDAACVDPYHVARKEALRGRVAPSTSVIVDGLLNRDARMDVQVLAATSASGYAVEPLGRERLNVPSTSGYAPCVRAGGMVFVAGQLARDASGAIAAEAMLPAGQLWSGTRIKLETDYLVRKRLVPALEAAGSSLELTLKAQVYLSHPEDAPAFWQAWSAAFGGRVPPTTVVPVRHPAFGTAAATIEVNLIAASSDARARIRDVECDVELAARDMVPARIFDGILFVAGLVGRNAAGARDDVADPNTPYYDDVARRQMLHVLAQADTIFSAANTSLAQLTRVLYFMPDLRRFRSVHDAWDAPLRHAGLPFTAIRSGPVGLSPDSGLVVDLWGYAPA